jgi:hypothetical protein
VLAAVGWGYKKVGLIGVGLALWIAADHLVGLFT